MKDIGVVTGDTKHTAGVVGIPSAWIATDNAILTLPTHIRARAIATMLSSGAKKAKDRGATAHPDY